LYPFVIFATLAAGSDPYLLSRVVPLGYREKKKAYVFAPDKAVFSETPAAAM